VKIYLISFADIAVKYLAEIGYEPFCVKLKKRLEIVLMI
jgi:hypothetical protein